MNTDNKWGLYWGGERKGLNGGEYGELLFYSWEMWFSPHLEKPEGGGQGWQAGPMSMDRFSRGKSGLYCT